MIVSGARVVPVRFSYASPGARTEGWGRFARLSANDAELLTQFKVERGDCLVLSFDLLGERFKNIRTAVRLAPIDSDGYYVAELRFMGPLSQIRLGRILRDLLTRQGV